VFQFLEQSFAINRIYPKKQNNYTGNQVIYKQNLEEKTMNTKELNVLVVNASARNSGSVTRRFAGEMITNLENQYEQVNIKHRDVSTGLPFVDEQWINANFTPAENRTDDHRATLALSDSLVQELHQADLIIIASPIYNFAIPASLKAWVDMIARVGLTFNYTSNGSVGKLNNKKAYIVMASGGTALGSDIDFASGYLRHVMGFIGIDDVSFISAERFDQDNEQATTDIRKRITNLVMQAA